MKSKTDPNNSSAGTSSQPPLRDARQQNLIQHENIGGEFFEL